MPLNILDDEYCKVAELLHEITDEMDCCMRSISDCKDLILWLREKFRGIFSLQNHLLA